MKTVRSTLQFSLILLSLTVTASLLGVRVEFPRMAYADTGFEYKSVYVAASLKNGEDDSGWKEVDEMEFLGDLRLALDQMSYEGFEVIEVSPVTRGWMDSTRVRHGISGGGHGITQGFVIIAQKPAS